MIKFIDSASSPKDSPYYLVNEKDKLYVEVLGDATSFSVKFKGKFSEDSEDSYVISGTNITDNTFSDTITKKGVYEFDTNAWNSVQASLISVSGGSVTVLGKYSSGKTMLV